MSKVTTSIISVPLFGVPSFSNLQRVSGVGGSAALSSSGAFSFDTLNDFDDLAEGETRELKFSYTATAADGTASGEIDITVEGDTGSSGSTLTGAQIKALYEAESDTNALTDARASKIDALILDGFIDYNNSAQPDSVPADTWHDIPNNGGGAFSNSAYTPEGGTLLIDTATGAIDPTQLALGDAILIRNDSTVTPTINNALFEFRYSLGGDGGYYTLPKTPFRLNRGAGVEDRIVSSTDFIYMGDENTRSNPIILQVKCSAAFSIDNAGSAILAIRRG